MTKAPRKAVIARSRLKNTYLKTQNNKNRENYKKQRTFCRNLVLKTKWEYFCNLNIKDLNDSKNFWEKN